MVKNMEKLLKIECLKGVPKLKSKMVEVVPKTLELDLINIEPYTEPGITVHVELELDQLEDPEE